MLRRRIKAMAVDLVGRPRRPRLNGGRTGTIVTGSEACGAVLLYHGVLSTKTDPWWIRVEPWRFAQQMRVVKEHLHPMSLEELQRAAEADAIPRGAVAITFDDGYVDNLRHAATVLENLHIPATVFVSSGYIGSERQYWWDELERLLIFQRRLPATLDMQVAGERMRWDLGNDQYFAPKRGDAWWRAWNADAPTVRHRMYAQLWRVLRGMEPETREAVLEQLRGWSNLPPYRGACRPMTVEELRTLGKHHMIEIGAHSVTHCSLGHVSQETQGREIVESKRRLEEWLQRAVRSFAYPFGAQQDYTGLTIDLLKQAGYERAATNHGGVVKAGVDPLRIPRVIAQAWPLSGFCRRLEQWLTPAT